MLLDWFNRMLSTGVLPSDWAGVVMVNLFKISRPKLAKHVRPIRMGSSVSKLFSRVLLERSLPLLGQSGTRRSDWTSLKLLIDLIVVAVFTCWRASSGRRRCTRCWRGLLDRTVSHLQTPWQNSSFSVPYLHLWRKFVCRKLQCATNGISLMPKCLGYLCVTCCLWMTVSFGIQIQGHL